MVAKPRGIALSPKISRERNQIKPFDRISTPLDLDNSMLLFLKYTHVSFVHGFIVTATEELPSHGNSAAYRELVFQPFHGRPKHLLMAKNSTNFWFPEITSSLASIEPVSDFSIFGVI